MRTDSLFPVLKAAIIAGLAAGLVMGLFHFFITESVIDQAISLEKQAKIAPGQTIVYEPELVSRSIQKPMVVVGSALYGLLTGIIFTVVFAIVGRRLPGRWPDVRAATLAGLLWWSVGLLPFLKYPANPPGVGDPATIYFREVIQIGFVILSALVLAMAGGVYLLLGRWPRKSWLRQQRLSLAVALYGVLAVLLFILMPDNPDPIAAPASLVWDFRILSMFGQALFWVILGGISALLLKRLAKQEVLEKTG